MKFEDYQNIVVNLSEAMSYFQDLETILYNETGKHQTEAGILTRLVQCYVAFLVLRLKEEFDRITD
jgi:hypothetical protein